MARRLRLATTSHVCACVSPLDPMLHKWSYSEKPSVFRVSSVSNMCRRIFKLFFDVHGNAQLSPYLLGWSCGGGGHAISVDGLGFLQ